MAMTTIGLADLLNGSPPTNHRGYREPYFTSHSGTYFGSGNGYASISMVTPAMVSKPKHSTSCKGCGAPLKSSECLYCERVY